MFKKYNTLAVIKNDKITAGVGKEHFNYGS